MNYCSYSQQTHDTSSSMSIGTHMIPLCTFERPLRLFPICFATYSSQNTKTLLQLIRTQSSNKYISSCYWYPVIAAPLWRDPLIIGIHHGHVRAIWRLYSVIDSCPWTQVAHPPAKCPNRNDNVIAGYQNGKIQLVAMIGVHHVFTFDIVLTPTEVITCYYKLDSFMHLGEIFHGLWKITWRAWDNSHWNSCLGNHICSSYMDTNSEKCHICPLRRCNFCKIMLNLFSKCLFQGKFFSKAIWEVIEEFVGLVISNEWQVSEWKMWNIVQHLISILTLFDG